MNRWLRIAGKLMAAVGGVLVADSVLTGGLETIAQIVVAVGALLARAPQDEPQVFRPTGRSQL